MDSAGKRGGKIQNVDMINNLLVFFFCRHSNKCKQQPVSHVKKKATDSYSFLC